tara:strand:- start:63 stop:338 length:276 start_codon:yes stop_codon:yes gene_type:complete
VLRVSGLTVGWWVEDSPFSGVLTLGHMVEPNESSESSWLFFLLSRLRFRSLGQVFALVILPHFEYRQFLLTGISEKRRQLRLSQCIALISI